jgi:putative sigma-54 modulation protein
MTLIAPSAHGTKLILRGIHIALTDAMKAALETKAGRLFRHHPDILRVRIDVEPDFHNRQRVFTAKGRIEIAGPDLGAAVTTGDAYKSAQLLIDKLDRMLRRRTTGVIRQRTTDDIRAHGVLSTLE